MLENTGATRQYDNFLLSRLSDDEFQTLRHYFELVHLSPNEVIYEQGASIQFVYFPVGCALSVLAL